MISKEKAQIIASYVEEHGKENACREFHIPEETLNRYLRSLRSVIKEDKPVEEDLEFIIKLEAQKQRLSDVNNVLRKENRETYRLFNSLEEVYKEYAELLKKCPLADFKIDHIVRLPETKRKYGICHLSDLHLNEIIDPREANGNVYDFVVASKRLKKYVTRAIHMFKSQGITDVLVAGTGDFINSDRRLSEKLVSATSQVRASLLATYLIQQVIMELAEQFTVSFAGVVGNESRIGEVDFDSSDILASNNWDYCIYQQLRMLFAGKSVEFIEADNNIQQVVTLDNGFNILLVHGNYLKGAISDKQISVLLQSYAYRGIPVHMVICGHIHSAAIGDIVSRSSGLCGGNSYSTNDLMFVSRASQNIYIVNDDMGYDGIKIDLQNTDGYIGYNIIPELERYNVRNASPNTKVTITSLV